VEDTTTSRKDHENSGMGKFQQNRGYTARLVSLISAGFGWDERMTSAKEFIYRYERRSSIKFPVVNHKMLLVREG